VTPTPKQRLDRLAVRIEELTHWRDRVVQDLPAWQFNGRPIALGERWPHTDGLVCLTHDEVAAPGEDAVLEVDAGGEGLLTIHVSNGSSRSFGLDPYHRRFPLGDAPFSVQIEAVARSPFGVPNRDPRLTVARVVRPDRAVETLVRRLSLVLEAGRVLGDHEVVALLIEAAERALQRLDWPSATIPYLSRTAASPRMLSIWSLPAGLQARPDGLTDAERATVTAAADSLAVELEALRDRFPPQGAVALTGHAHLDLAWLWPLEETRRKARRTFHSASDLLDRYADLVFNQSSAQLYAFVESDDPDLFAAIRRQVAGGQWEPIGGMWVEPDANMPAGESLVRQLLYGQRYFKSHFGAYHDICWMPDCFGFTPALPQILRGSGIKRFFTIKVTWSETNRFPYDLFWWEGLDGSRVLAHVFDNPSDPASSTSGYNGNVGPSPSLETWRRYRGKADSAETLLSVGYGDGGGGVTAEMAERSREMARLPVIPHTRFDTVRAFFERAERSVVERSLPVWTGELYLELHRGTLTTQGRTKWLHRRAERDLVAAEVAGSLAALAGATLPESLEQQWRVLLRNQFHDILPGSGIREVYQRAEQELAGVVAEAGSALESALAELSQRVVPEGNESGILALNPDLSARPLRIESTELLPGAQSVEGGYVLTSPETVPLLGIRVVTHFAGPGVRADERSLENESVRIVLDDAGRLISVRDKIAGREALAGPANQIWAYVDKPREWDAWDIDAGYADQGEEIVATEIAVVERGPHRAALRVTRHFRDSRIVQDIRLWSNSRRIEFKTSVSWHDRHWLLQARFPLAIRARNATFETAFGVVERPTHRSTSWDSARFEVAAHRFVDLSEPGYGVALLNDGKYGHHALRNELGISLLRSPTYPDPLADEGEQTFTYALLPHAGSWIEGGVLAEAEDLNRPLLFRAVRGTAGAWQPIRLDGPPLGLGALKRAEDGDGLILRVYEPQGARGPVGLQLPDGWTASADLDLLERVQRDADLSVLPFQIRTWLLEKN